MKRKDGRLCHRCVVPLAVACPEPGCAAAAGALCDLEGASTPYSHKSRVLAAMNRSALSCDCDEFRTEENP